MVRGIAKLRVLTESTFDDYPNESIKKHVEQAVKDHDQLVELFRELVPCTIMADNSLYANPDVYNKIVEILNESL